MSANATLTEMRGKLDARRKILGDVIAEATVPGSRDLDMDRVTTFHGSSAEKVHQMRAMNDEIDDLASKIEAHIRDHGDPAEFAAMRDRLDGLGQVQRPPIHGEPAQRPAQSIGEMFVKSAAYTDRVENAVGPQSTLDVGWGDVMAATMTTAAGFAPESTRTGRIVDSAMRPVQISDLVHVTPTTQAAVKFMEETTATNAAAERAENGSYPEAALELTERTNPVKSIGVSLPITDEQLEDEPAAAAYVDGRLMFFVRQRVDGQILVGDGTGANITGYMNTSGLQTQVGTSLTTLDAVLKAMTKVRTNGRATPTAVVIHPTNFETVLLTKTVDGIYIYGNPANGGPDRMWGATVVQSDANAAGTALVGDFSPAWSEFAVRRGVEVQVGYVSTDFTNGRVTLRGGMRGTLVVYRGAAFCKVTALT